jgi:hypothetical protein
VKNLGVSATFVHKAGHNLIGWKDIGGVYGTQTVIEPDGQTVVVYPLLNATSARKFLRTNGPGTFTRYNGLLLTMNKRWSQRWQANVSYTYSKADGLTTTAQDPNGDVNNGGRLSLDRPQMVMVTASYRVPVIDVMVSPNYLGVSGTPYAPQALVTLPQGRLTVNIAPAGNFRLDSQQLLSLRFSKTVLQRADRRLELIAYISNVFQNKAGTALSSQNYYTPQFGVVNAWAEPRQLYFVAKVQL